MTSEVKSTIREKIDAGLERLPSRLRQWAEQHLVEPRKITARRSVDDPASETEAWLVTDHVGERDSGYRVIYDEESGTFGLITTIKGGPEYYLGLYGEFDETVEGM